MLPDCSYKSIKGRALKLAEDLKKLAKSIWDFGAKVASRRGRNSKYGLGIVTEETYLEIERNAAIDSEKIMKKKAPRKLGDIQENPEILWKKRWHFSVKRENFQQGNVLPIWLSENRKSQKWILFLQRRCLLRKKCSEQRCRWMK